MTRQWPTGSRRLLIAIVALTLLMWLLTTIQCKPRARVQALQDRRAKVEATSDMVEQNSINLKVKTPVPVIGVLSQVLRDYKRFTKERHLHIASSYIKWLESAGAQVLPILLNQEDAYYERVFKQTNGLLFPGGDNLLDPNKATPMMVAAKKLYRLAVEANERGDFYPIWGTCLGLELLSVLTAKRNVLEDCSAVDDPLPMEFVGRGKLFAPASYANLPSLSPDYSGAILNALASKRLTYNYHHKCLTDAGLKRANLAAFYRPLAYSNDTQGLRFIAMLEAIEYPFYGVQFHPEKPPFEFVVKAHQLSIPHSAESIAVSRYFADFFVQQAQRNGHPIDERLIQSQLIYAFQPTYTAPLHDMYEQRYLFPFGGNPSNASTEEFIDHVPAEDEQVPEDVSDSSSDTDQQQQQPLPGASCEERRLGQGALTSLKQLDGGLINSVDQRTLYVISSTD